jgi:hypothetical protein
MNSIGLSIVRGHHLLSPELIISDPITCVFKFSRLAKVPGVIERVFGEGIET